MNKKWYGIIAFVLAFGLLAACGTTNEQSTGNTTNTETSQTEGQTGSGGGEAAQDKDIVETIEETGIYNGQADPHTIEVQLDDGPLAFQLSTEAREQVKDIKVDDKVKFTYTEEGNNRTIISIKKVE